MVPFAPEALFHIGSFPITNSFINTLLVDAMILSGTYILYKHISHIPGRFQNMIELVFDGFYGLTKSVSSKNAGLIFPYIMAFFLVIILTNWSGLLPGVGSIGIKQEAADAHEQSTIQTTHKIEQTTENKHEQEVTELIPLVRAGTSDINMTLALALISVIATHVMSISVLGFPAYLSRFLSFNPIYLFVGLLELVSEFTKIISLSFRLFGNIYAGEVVLHTIQGMFAFLAPLPFLTLEIIVAIVQALVFSFLTMAFMAIFTTPHHENHNDDAHAHSHNAA